MHVSCKFGKLETQPEDDLNVDILGLHVASVQHIQSSSFKNWI